MALPKDELAVTVHNYVSPIHNDHIEVLASRAYEQGDMVIEGTALFRPCGIADTDIAINTMGCIHIEGGIRVDSNRIHAGENFNTWGEPVYYDTTTLEYYQANPNNAFWCVGFVVEVQDANGSFSFEKYRYAFLDLSTT